MMFWKLLFFFSTQQQNAFAEDDWLVAPMAAKATVFETCWDDDDEICGLELSNGLLRRRFALAPAFGTVDFEVYFAGEGWRSMFRAVEPEAVIGLDGGDVAVGGLVSSDFRGYCNRTSFAESLEEASPSSALSFRGYRVAEPEAPYDWTPGIRHSDDSLQWPPRGKRLEIDFGGGANKVAEAVVAATVVYELYDGLPLLTKSVRVDAPSSSRVDRVDVELFAANAGFGEYYSGRGPRPPGFDDDGAATTRSFLSPLLHAKTDQAYGFQCAWVDDDDAPKGGCDDDTCDDDDEGAVEPLLNCSASLGVTSAAALITTGRVLLLGLDSADLERQSLARHRAFATLAPQVTESPIFFHWSGDVDDRDAFEAVVAEMTDVGFEMLVFSFGTSFALENTTDAYLDDIASKVAYARANGVEVGGYDLIVRDRGKGGYGGDVGDQFAVVGPDGASLQEDACFASGWVDQLRADVLEFLDRTNLSMLELDGPYGGVPCFSTTHAHHRDARDSVYRQTTLQNNFFKKLRERGVYVNTPDEYLYAGANRAPMGYAEQQFSLPAWQDITISRMGLFDDLYFRLPTAGWTFAPLTVYHGGGDAAAFDDKPDVIDWALGQYLGAGTAACYRGDRLFDDATDLGRRVKNSLQKWVQHFFKRYRRTLTKPIIHLRRPDLQSWDGWLHVNPFSDDDVAVALIFNPTNRDLRDISITLPLYYAVGSAYCGDLLGTLTFLVDDARTTPAGARPLTCAITLHFATIDRLSIHTVVVERRAVVGANAVSAVQAKK